MSTPPVQQVTTPTHDELRDRVQITDLIYRMGACLDEHRFDDLRALFTADATATTPGGTAVGQDALVAQAIRNHVAYERLQHLVTGPIVEVDGVTAKARANLVGIFCNDKGIPERVIGGAYQFSSVKANGQWRLNGLKVTPTWLVPNGI